MPSPIQKGWKGGPGRPRKAVEAGGLELLATVCDIETRKNIIRSMVCEALAGSVSAASWLWDRIYGKPAETVQLLGLLREEAANMTEEELDAELRKRGLEWALK